MSDIDTVVPSNNKADEQVLLLVVGGVHYSLSMDLMTKYPDSFFANLVKPQWNSESGTPVIIERDVSTYTTSFATGFSQGTRTDE